MGISRQGVVICKFGEARGKAPSTSCPQINEKSSIECYSLLLGAN